MAVRRRECVFIQSISRVLADFVKEGGVMTSVSLTAHGSLSPRASGPVREMSGL